MRLTVPIVRDRIGNPIVHLLGFYGSEKDYEQKKQSGKSLFHLTATVHREGH